MDTVENIYKELFNDSYVWDYYKKDGTKFRYPFDPIDAPIKSKEFIEKFFNYSGKDETFFLENFSKKLGNRSLHFVSAFFMGIYLYENSQYVREKINDELSKYQSEGHPAEFRFIWFLICFFHDLGYFIEEDKKPRSFKSFTDFFDNKFKNYKTKKLDKCDGVPKLYEDIYKPYFDYIINTRYKNDHGICTAFIMFKDLCEIREAKEKIADDDLNWHKSLEKVYNFVSWIVLAHNVWYINKNGDCCDVKRYTCAGLHKLIRNNDNDYKIRFEEHPTFFLFCLVDSIEFLKKIKDVSCLSDIELGIEHADTYECAIIVKSNLPCGCNDIVLNSSNSLNDWLTKTYRKGKQVKIFLNP